MWFCILMFDITYMTHPIWHWVGTRLFGVTDILGTFLVVGKLNYFLHAFSFYFFLFLWYLGFELIYVTVLSIAFFHTFFCWLFVAVARVLFQIRDLMQCFHGCQMRKTYSTHVQWLTCHWWSSYNSIWRPIFKHVSFFCW